MAGNNFKLAGEDAASFTVQHPDGSHFKIAKHVIHDVIAHKIRSLAPVEKMSDGGVAGGDDNTIDYSKADYTNQSTPEDAPYGSGPPLPTPSPVPASPPSSDAVSVNIPGVTPDAAPSSGLPASTPSAGGTQSLADPIQQYMKGQNQQAQGIQQIMGAKSKEGSDTADAYQKYIDTMKVQNEATAVNFKNMNSALDAETKEYQTQKIDPNRIWHNSSLGGKISAAIGIVLGGIGGGMTHSPNAALGVIKDLTDNDIEAQKADINNKHTLFQMNMEKYRNVQLADTATRLQMINALDATIKKSVAQSGSAQAMGNGNMLLGQLQTERAGMMQKFALMQTQAQSLGAGGGQGGLPVKQEPYALLADKDYQGRRIVVGDRAFQAATPEDAKDLKGMLSEYGPVKDQVQQLSALGPSALIPGTPDNMKATALRASLVPKLNKLHGLNRLSEEDIKLMGNQLSDPTKFSQLMTSGLKNNQFMNNLNDDLESNLSTRLIGYKGPSSYKTFNKLGQVK